jgi:hypothetical protein
VTSTNKKDVKNDVKNGYEAPWNAKIIKMRTNASFIYYSGAWKGLSEIVVVNLSQQKRLSSFFFCFIFTFLSYSVSGSSTLQSFRSSCRGLALQP